jgi:hypothetical protein
MIDLRIWDGGNQSGGLWGVGGGVVLGFLESNHSINKGYLIQIFSISQYGSEHSNFGVYSIYVIDY